MTQLLSQYSLTEIILFIISLLLAVKGAWDLFDYFKNKYNEKFNKDLNKKVKENELEQHYLKCEAQHNETIEIYAKLEDKLDTIVDSIDSIKTTVDDLVGSDMLDIKQFLVREYHYFVEQKKWIDDYSLNCILLRYEVYKKEGGNSYIDTLISEIKALPKHPPVE